MEATCKVDKFFNQIVKPFLVLSEFEIATREIDLQETLQWNFFEDMRTALSVNRMTGHTEHHWKLVDRQLFGGIRFAIHRKIRFTVPSYSRNNAVYQIFECLREDD